MAKLINKHFGMIVSIEPTEKTKDDATWLWRKDYEGFLGIMHIYKSERKCPEKHFIAICDIDLNGLETSIGELKGKDNILTLTTTNSIYTFKIVNIDGRTVNKWQQKSY